MVRPYRKEKYKYREKMSVYVKPEMVQAMKAYAKSFGVSTSHMMEMLLELTIEEGGDLVASMLDRRVRRGLMEARRIYDERNGRKWREHR